MAESYSLRRASADDVAAIRSLILQSQVNPLGLDWRRFVVAVTPEDEIIGIGQVKPHRDGSNELASIAVEPAWRRRGVARAIIEHLLASHQVVLYLMCRSSLGPLYEKFGFIGIGQDEMPKYFRRVSRLARLTDLLHQDGETLLVMQRNPR